MSLERNSGEGQNQAYDKIHRGSMSEGTEFSHKKDNRISLINEKYTLSQKDRSFLPIDKGAKSLSSPLTYGEKPIHERFLEKNSGGNREIEASVVNIEGTDNKGIEVTTNTSERSPRIDTSSSRPRFKEDAFHENPQAVLRHFTPLPLQEGETIPRDRFGNRVFTSADKGYVDREGKETKAAILVSPKGETFIKANLGILNDINKGLISLTTNLKPDSQWETIDEIDLGKNRKMKKMSEAGQSNIYLLETDSEKYVVKIKADNPRTKDNPPSQPYINEMLQSQMIATDLSSELNEAGISMPTFLFASGQVSCTKFENGEHPNTQELSNKLYEFIPKVQTYMRNQQTDLWQNIAQDAIKTFWPFEIITPEAEELHLIKVDNFIQRP